MESNDNNNNNKFMESLKSRRSSQNKGKLEKYLGNNSRYQQNTHRTYTVQDSRQTTKPLGESRLSNHLGDSRVSNRQKDSSRQKRDSSRKVNTSLNCGACVSKE